MNFLLNRNWVFGIRGERKRGRSFLRYFILCSGIALASALLVSAVSGISGADPVLAKIPVRPCPVPYLLYDAEKMGVSAQKGGWRG